MLLATEPLKALAEKIREESAVPNLVGEDLLKGLLIEDEADAA